MVILIQTNRMSSDLYSFFSFFLYFFLSRGFSHTYILICTEKILNTIIIDHHNYHHHYYLLLDGDRCSTVAI